MLSSINDLEIIELWLGGRASAHTRACYRRDANRLLTQIGKPLNRISLGDLQDFSQSLVDSGLAPISRARTIAAIKSLFGFCCRMRHLPSNPAAELSLPSYEKRLAERIVGEDDIQRMLAGHERPRDRTLLRLLYTAGLRVSEACGLRWRNLSVRGDAGQITVFGKNGRTRSVALTSQLWSELISFTWNGRLGGASLPVEKREVPGSRPSPRYRASSRGTLRCRRIRQSALAAARARFPRARSRRADSSRASDPWPQLSSDDQQLPSRPPG